VVNSKFLSLLLANEIKDIEAVKVVDGSAAALCVRGDDHHVARFTVHCMFKGASNHICSLLVGMVMFG